MTAFSHIRNNKNLNFDDIQFFESPMKFISMDSVNKLLKQIKQDTSTHVKRDLIYMKQYWVIIRLSKSRLSIDIENRMFVNVKKEIQF